MIWCNVYCDAQIRLHKILLITEIICFPQHFNIISSSSFDCMKQWWLIRFKNINNYSWQYKLQTTSSGTFYFTVTNSTIVNQNLPLNWCCCTNTSATTITAAPNKQIPTATKCITLNWTCKIILERIKTVGIVQQSSNWKQARAKNLISQFLYFVNNLNTIKHYSMGFYKFYPKSWFEIKYVGEFLRERKKCSSNFLLLTTVVAT